MNFSIAIVTYNRKKSLERCLDSIKKCSIKLPYEVVVIFNGETSYISSTNKQYPDAKTFYIPSCSPAKARNLAISKCNGDYIFFLDDDCHLPENYFDKINLSLNWDVLGGPDKTPPLVNNFERNLGYALSSPLCMGLTYKRHDTNNLDINIVGDESKLILCNLWFKRSLFENPEFLFPEDLFRNEENYLLKKLKLANKVIYYNPSLYVFHSRKSDLHSLSLSVIKSGECRVKNFLKLPDQRELLYTLPAFFTLLFLYLLFHPISYVALAFLFYTVSIVAFLIKKYKRAPLFSIFLHYYILIIYSFGLIVGLKNALLSYINITSKIKTT